MRRINALVPMVAAIALWGCQTGGLTPETADSFTISASYVQQETWACSNFFKNPALAETNYCIIIKEGPVDGHYSILAYETLANGDWGERVGLNALASEMPINLRYLRSGKSLNVTCNADGSCDVSRGTSPSAFGTIFMQGGHVMAGFGNDDGTCEVIPGAVQFRAAEFHGNINFFRASGSRTVRDGQTTNVTGFGDVRCNAERVTVS